MVHQDLILHLIQFFTHDTPWYITILNFVFDDPYVITSHASFFYVLFLVEYFIAQKFYVTNSTREKLM